MYVGTFGAFKQIEIKRFIAYTSIAQVGFIMLGLSTLSLGGLISAILYLFIYAIMSVGFFNLLLNTQHISTKKNVIYLSEVYGVAYYSPRAARALSVFLYSMAGIPPLGGFIGKLFIYISAIDSGLELVVLFSVVLSTISTYYYLNLIKCMWFVRVYYISRQYYVILSFVASLLMISTL
jgi:NADH-quinone oxidoreductase subunit N